LKKTSYAWILHSKILDKSLTLFTDLAKQLLRYDFSQIDEDFFKEIYEEIVERGLRHRTGEYYTPEWLVELVLQEALALWREKSSEPPRILDPACGSGTFLYNAIRLLRRELSEKGKSEEEILKFILNNILGVDINPLAVTIARANYVLALGDLLHARKSPVLIPVYVADSIKIPESKQTLHGILAYKYKLPNSEKDALLAPVSVAKDPEKMRQVIKAFKDAIELYRNSKNKQAVYNVFTGALSSTVTKKELEVLKITLDTILRQIDKGLDSIWVFMLSNIYAPALLAEVEV